MSDIKKTKERKSGSFHFRNKLNDLTAKEWIIGTKSVWCHSDYDLDDNLPTNLRHYKKIILFFTKRRGSILISNNDRQDLVDLISNLSRVSVSKTNRDVDLILSEETQHFSNLEEYHKNFNTDLKQKYYEYYEKLKKEHYLCVILRNFYLNRSELVLFHYDLCSLLRQIGFKLKGLTIWVPTQNHTIEDINPNKNIFYDYILIFRKEKQSSKLNEFKINFESINEFKSKTKYFPSYTLSVPPPRDEFKAMHPATFAESDVKELITYFTDITSNPKVLDPFCGVGSTLMACQELGIEGWGIELTKKWISLTKKRFHKIIKPIKINGKVYTPKQQQLSKFFQDSNDEINGVIQNLILGDSKEKILNFKDNFFDFIVTSPPYWGILTKRIDHKAKRERVDKGLEVKYTIEGKDDTYDKDLGNLESYDDFLNQLKSVYQGCYQKLKYNSYMAVIVSDFRHRDEFFLYHCDMTRLLKEIGLKLTGLTILHQDNKNLYPYGYPFVFVSNVHHQNIIIVKKE